MKVRLETSWEGWRWKLTKAWGQIHKYLLIWMIRKAPFAMWEHIRFTGFYPATEISIYEFTLGEFKTSITISQPSKKRA